MTKNLSALPIPEDLVSMAHVAGAFGIRGWVHVVAETEYADSLLDYPTVWMRRKGATATWFPYEIESCQVQAKGLAIHFKGIEDRDAALALRGMEMAVPRSEMPDPEEDEFYWADLIGASVNNTEGICLGTVKTLLATGAHDVLVVTEGETERLIPFVEAFVLSVDTVAKTIQVEWGADY